MVGFVHYHLDRPFVMGGMFHGKVALGGGAENRVKSIMTRSGHKIIFTEDESIVITDKSGNEIHLDTAGSNINITAPETMTLNCKNMNINVGENMTTTIGKNQSTTVGNNQTNSVGMHQTESVGMMKYLSVGANFMTNVVGSLMEIVRGKRASQAKEVKENSRRREEFLRKITTFIPTRPLTITVVKIPKCTNYVNHQNYRGRIHYQYRKELGCLYRRVRGLRWTV